MMADMRGFFLTLLVLLWSLLPQSLLAAPHTAADTGSACDEEVVIATLASRFPIAPAGEAGAARTFTGSSIACAEHPLLKGQTLVAFFYWESEGDWEGLALAQIEDRTRRLIRFYGEALDRCCQQTFQASLSLEASAFPLKRGVRGIGVRLQGVGRSIHGAEGGDGDEVRLLIAEGRADFRPILRLALTSWHLVGDASACWRSEEPACEYEDSRSELSLALSRTAGWRDLRVTTTTVNRDHPEQRRVRRQTLKMFHQIQYQRAWAS